MTEGGGRGEQKVYSGVDVCAEKEKTNDPFFNFLKVVFTINNLQQHQNL